MRHKGNHHHEDHTVIVTIDDATVEKLEDISPLSLTNHLQLLETLSMAQPKAIAYFINFNDIMTANEEIFSPKTLQEAHAFVKKAEFLAESGIPVWLGADVDVTGEIIPPFPLSKLPH